METIRGKISEILEVKNPTFSGRTVILGGRNPGFFS